MDDAALALEQEDADVERVAVDAPDWRAGCGHGDEDGNAPSLGVQFIEERLIPDPFVLDEVMRKGLRVVQKKTSMRTCGGLPEGTVGEKNEQESAGSEPEKALG